LFVKPTIVDSRLDEMPELDPPRCPICGHAVTDKLTRPFCSQRCRQIDLGEWLDGSYRIAGPRHLPEDADDGSPDA
jgi:hypothetical protein